MENKISVKTIDQLKGFEGEIKKLEDGTEAIVSSDGMNIVNGSGQHGNITQQDLQDLLDALALVPQGNMEGITWVAYTGFGGWMTIVLQKSFDKFGIQKLPRKLKKKWFKDKKSRRRYLPQYYKNQNYYRY